MRYLTIIILNFMFSLATYASDTLHVSTHNVNCNAIVSNIDNWIEGYAMGESSLTVYMNTSVDEFQSFLDSYGVSSLTLELYWKSNSGNQLLKENTFVLDANAPGFDIRDWSVTHQPANLNEGYYVVKVLIEESLCASFVTIPLVEEEEEEEEPLPIELPAYECGEDYNHETPENSHLESAESGDVFLVGGLPILLQDVSPASGPGKYSGSGIVPLPFTNKILTVEFTGIHVNANKKVTSGQVLGLSDDIQNYPNFNPDTDVLNIGGEICIPQPETPGYNQGVDEETGLNERGFDPDTGLHNETGTPYDPNGFNSNGTHSNGTPYNECGCSLEGVTETGEVCDIDCGPNPEAEEYADKVADDLPGDITTIIGQLSSEQQLILNDLNCDNIRTQMDNLIQSLFGANNPNAANYIKGENQEYFAVGMHQNFAERPAPLPININTRNSDAVDLELKHIELYDCDKKSHAINAYATVLNTLNANSEDFQNYILDKIRNWSGYMLGQMEDPEKFQEWLIREIGQYMMDNSGVDNSYHELFALEDNRQDNREEFLKEHIKSIFDFSPKGRYNDIASADKRVIFDDAFSLADASFEFKQGFQKINGVDRAFYLEELERQQSLVVSEANGSLLPIVVEKTVGNKTYKIFLDNLILTPTGATLDAFLIITDPESGKRLVFKGLGLTFGPTGLTGNSRLSLESEVEIRLNNSSMLILNAGEQTYAEWDCDGFAGMGIGAAIEFCRNFITPLDPSTLDPVVDEEERYRLEFDITMDSWLEFSIEIGSGNTPAPFAVTKYEDIKWSMNNIVLDFSSASTPASVKPPSGYASPFLSGSEMTPLWKGVYIGALSVRFPNNFSTSSQPITASAEDVVIDGSGFSGGLFVENLIPMEDGNLGGWPFSISDFYLKILNNSYAGAGFGGGVKIPVFEEPLAYKAVMYPKNEYYFSVKTTDELTADVFAATATLKQNSSIEVKYVDGDIEAKATLNGDLRVNTENIPGVNKVLKLPAVTFQNLEISNKPDYFSAGTWGIATSTNGEPIASVGFNGFGVKLHDIKPLHTSSNTHAGLNLDLEVILVDNESFGFGARGNFDVKGILETDQNNRQDWNFESIDLHALAVDTHFPGVKKLYGELVWYDEDPVFGKGFRGAVDLQMEFITTDISIEAIAQFGKISNSEHEYKYFFVDAMTTFSGLSPSVGALKLTGFGGGLSYHMNIEQDVMNLVSASSNTMPPLGTSLSGTVFTPDPNRGLGIKAVVGLATQNENIFNGVGGFTLEFNGNNGLSELTIFGAGQFLKGVDMGIQPEQQGDQPPASVNAPLSAFLDFNLKFADQNSGACLDGTLEVFLNAGIVEGTGTGGKMVTGKMYFAEDDWYIYLGKPIEDEEASIRLNLPFITAESKAYFTIGTDVPPMKPLPPEVQEIAYKVNKNQSFRQSGAGFVFGASINIEAAVSAGSFVSANATAKAGFDLALLKYNNLKCFGSNDLVGIDGWYATGQVYAFVEGQVKIFGVNVLQAGVAAVLQARLPDPFFAQATVGVRVKVGFFPAVNKSVAIRLGDDCQLYSDDVTDQVGVDVIPFVLPNDGAEKIPTDAEVYGIPVTKINQSVNLTTYSGEHNYHISIAEHSLEDSNGYGLPHDVIYNSIDNKVVWNSGEFLPADETITAIIKLEVKENGQHVAFQSDTTVFTTDAAIEVIPLSNVEYTYPVDGMRNFHKAEYIAQKGFVKLKTYQPHIINQFDSRTFAQFTAADGGVYRSPVSFNYLLNQIEFDMPENQLSNGQYYRMDIVKLGNNFVGTTQEATSGSGSSNLLRSLSPANTTETSDGAPQYALNSVGSGFMSKAMKGSGGDLPSPTLSNNLDGGEGDKIFFTLFFRVSDYDTFNDKMDAIMANSHANFWHVKQVVEPFDELDISDTDNQNALVSFNSDVSYSYLDNLKTQLYNYLPKELPNIFFCEDMNNLLHVGRPDNPYDEEYKYFVTANGDTPPPIDENVFVSGEESGTNYFQTVINNINLLTRNHKKMVNEKLNGCLDEGVIMFGQELMQMSPNGPPLENLSLYNVCEYIPHNLLCEGNNRALASWFFYDENTFPVTSGQHPFTVTYRLPNGHTTTQRTDAFIKP